MGSPMVPSHLTSGNLERSNLGHQDFEAIYLVNEPS